MLGAEPPPVTRPWLITGDVAPGSTFTVTVIGGKEAPGASVVVRVQLVGPQVQPVPAIETGMRPGGGISLTATVPVVVPAPMLFDTVSVYVAFVCPWKKFPVCVFAMLNEGTPAGTIVVESLAIAVGDPPPTVWTWFTCGEVAVAATLTVMVMGGYDAPTASTSLRLHWAGLQVHPVPAIETTVSPAGGISIICTGPMVGCDPTFDTITVYLAFVCPWEKFAPWVLVML